MWSIPHSRQPNSLSNRARALDNDLYRRARSDATNQGLVTWVRRASGLGEHGGIWLGLGLVGTIIDSHRRKEWCKATVSVAVAYGISTSVKLLIRRPRPTDLPPLTDTPTDLSFPSSHAVTSFAAARVYSEFLPSSPLYITALAFGYSRLYLGVHYPSDIVAGATLGYAVGSLARYKGRPHKGGSLPSS